METIPSRATMPALLLAAALVVAGCTASGAPAASHAKAAEVEVIEGSTLKLVRLTPEAADRLGIATAATIADGRKLVVPYGAIFYDPNGAPWVYVERAPLQFVREAVTIDDIDGDLATLAAGPAAGTNVVTTGVAELYGTEFEVGH